MEMEGTILRWINGTRNYQQGIQLLRMFGKDSVLLSLFLNEHETAYKRQRLLQELQALLNTKEAPEQEVNPSTVPPPPLQHQGWPAREKADSVIRALHEKWRPLFSEMMHLSHRLADMTTENERGQAAHRILALDDECEEIYQKRDYYLQHGVLPENKTPHAVIDPVKWPVKLANAKRYVRDYTIKCQKEPGNERFAAKLEAYRQEIKHYMELLKIDIAE